MRNPASLHTLLCLLVALWLITQYAIPAAAPAMQRRRTYTGKHLTEQAATP